jgi:hydroxymethylbilane synthase
LRHLRPGLRIEGLRGNVETRLRKLDEGRYDAVVLAAAGLRRLGLEGRIAEVLDPEVMCPAVGQGALAIQCRRDDLQSRRRLEHLDDLETEAATAAERSMLIELGGGCQLPVGGWARLEGGSLRLTAVVASPDGAEVLRATLSGEWDHPVELGRRVGEELRRQGANRILEQVYAP